MMERKYLIGCLMEKKDSRKRWEMIRYLEDYREEGGNREEII
jgi:hypothetical protein